MTLVPEDHTLANEASLYLREDWIQAHNPAIQDAVREVAESIQHVSFAKFKEMLGVSVRDIKEKLSDRVGPNRIGGFDSKRDAVVLIEGYKSNKWVAEIAMHEFGFQPESFYRLGEKNARSFVEYVNANLVESRAALRGKTVVLFDDGSYSGTQMTDHVKAIRTLAQKHKIEIKSIAVVVPYMTDLALEKLQTLELNQRRKKRGQGEIPVVISSHERISTLADLEHVDDIQRIWGKTIYKNTPLDALGLLWFDHKVPNDQSFGGIPLVRKTIVDSDGTPKNQNFSGELIPDVIPVYKQQL